MNAKTNAPIIIKRKKIVAGGGHHGGAWKVAYADFVTAMMAFFMLMWLLNATTEVQRKGIADYFNPTIPINRISGGGEGMFGGDNIFSENSLAKNGTGATRRRPTEQLNASGDEGSSQSLSDSETAKNEDSSLLKLEELLTARNGESMVSPEAARHIVTRVTDEGLIIEMFDLPGAPLFDVDGTRPTLLMSDLIGMVASVIALVKNDVAVNGFVAAKPIVIARNPVWDVSSDRADRVRLLLQDGGLPTTRVQRVTGYADRKPVVSNPMSLRNNRVEVILLREQPN